MQAWGHYESKFAIRRAAEAPTKSGVIGLLLAALGIPRTSAPDDWLGRLNSLLMGVRVDRPGVRWWDYHTVGAGLKMRTAEGKNKDGPLLTRREFLCDASFLVALNGEPALIKELYQALQQPKWTLYLGRKCCPPSRPILAHAPGCHKDLPSALQSVPWEKRYADDTTPEKLEALLEWRPSDQQPNAPDDAEIWYDAPQCLEPPAHGPRFITRTAFSVAPDGQVTVAPQHQQQLPLPPPRPRANYNNSAYQRARDKRLHADHGLCVFCKNPATTVQHITYRRAGGNETTEDLRSLCRLCHDAVTMIEYGLGLEMGRINPEDPQWRDAILKKRTEIIQFRSLENRRRFLQPEEV